MKAIHLFYGFVCTLSVLSLTSSSSWSGNDGYVGFDENGTPTIPAAPRVRNRKMPKPTPKPEGTGFSDPSIPKPTKAPAIKKAKESDEVRVAKEEQKRKDAETEKNIRERLRRLNALRISKGLTTMFGMGCKNDECTFVFDDGSGKSQCTGNVESFLMDESPGFKCSGKTCFLDSSNGKMDCSGGTSGNPSPTPTTSPNPQCRMVNGVYTCGDEPPCNIDPARGIYNCDPRDNPRRDMPGGGNNNVQDAI